MQRRPLYRVRIFYTEPAFQVRLANAPDFYSIDYLVVDAGSADQAVEAAMREWKDCVARSRVGWRRFIESIEISRPSGPRPDGWEIRCGSRSTGTADAAWRAERHHRHRAGRRGDPPVAALNREACRR